MASNDTYDLSTWHPEAHQRPGRTRAETKTLQQGSQATSAPPPAQTPPPAPKPKKEKKSSAATKTKSTGQASKVTKPSAASTGKAPSKSTAAKKSTSQKSSSKGAPSKSARASSGPAAKKSTSKGPASKPARYSPAPASKKKATTSTGKASSKKKTTKAASSASSRSSRESSARVSKSRGAPARKDKQPSPYRGTARPTGAGRGSHYRSGTLARQAPKQVKTKPQAAAAPAAKSKASSSAAAPPSALPPGIGSTQTPYDGPKTNGLKHLSSTNGEWVGERHRAKLAKYRELSPERRQEVENLRDTIIETSVRQGDKTMEEMTAAVREHMLAFAANGISTWDDDTSGRWMKRARTSLVSCAAREAADGNVYFEPRTRV